MHPVGISDQSIILDSKMTASSEFNNNFKAGYGRLNGKRGDGWCTKTNHQNDWLQVDLGKTIQMCAVATQGDINGNEWTEEYKLFTSSDGKTWKPYKDENGAEMVRFGLVYEPKNVTQLGNDGDYMAKTVAHKT